MSSDYKKTVNKLMIHMMITIMFLAAFGAVSVLNSDQAHALSKVVKITADTLNVRADASTSAKKVGELHKGDYRRVISSKTDSKSMKWYRVDVDNTTGFVRSDYTESVKFTIVTLTDKKGTVTTNGGALTVRTGPGTIFEKTGTVKNGKIYTVNAKAKDMSGTYWYRFKLDGVNVYASSKYMKLKTVTSTEPSESSETTPSETKPTETKTDTKTTIKIGTVTTSSSSLNVRTGAGTSYSKLGTLANGSVITITGSTKSTSGVTWYKYDYSSKKTGYVCGTYLKITKLTEDPDFEKYMKKQGFPESYKAGLRILHSVHPNWTFKAVSTGSSWTNALNAETSSVGRNLVAPTLPASYRSKEKGAYNSKTNTWTRFDGRWYAANKQVVAYYMDPRNFLTEDGIYQFMTHQYDADSQSTKTVKAVVKGTFMETRSPNSSTYSSYASLINAAGKNAGVNPNVIAAMIVQEQGVNGTSGLISGTYSGYKGYYNFFNVGAYTTSTMSAVQRGLWYAKQSGSYGRPWNSVYKAIKGGALFYGSNYVNAKQDTYYYKKFNVKNGVSKIGTHQYMTNVSAAASEGKLLKNAFSANPKYSAVIELPIYSSMPNDACPLP